MARGYPQHREFRPWSRFLKGKKTSGKLKKTCCGKIATLMENIIQTLMAIHDSLLKCDILNVNWCKISSTGCISAKWKKTLTQISEFPPLFSRRTETVGHFDLAGKAQKDNQILHLIHRQLLLCSLLNGIFLPRCHFWVRQQKAQPKDLENTKHQLRL